MKYRSLTHLYFMRSIFMSNWSIIPSRCITFLHQTVFKIFSKITGPRSLIYFMRLPYVLHWFIIPNMTFIIIYPFDVHNILFCVKIRVSWETVALPEKKFGHVLGCRAGVFGESGSVNQCGTKGKVYGCKLNLHVNHQQKPALLS